MQWNGSGLSVTGAITATSLNVTNATVTGTLSASNLKIDDSTIAADENGNLIVKTDGIGTTQISVTNLGSISDDLGTVTAGTFKTADSGYRVEVSNSGDFPIWYGTGTKTAANGLFYVDSLGAVYINAIIVARAGSTIAVLKASVAPVVKLGFTSSITTAAAVLTVSNGTGPYTYSWVRQITINGPTPTISDSTIVNPTFTASGMTVGVLSTSIWEVVVTDTITSESASAQAYVTITREP
jgi:hypothetical protein